HGTPHTTPNTTRDNPPRQVGKRGPHGPIGGGDPSTTTETATTKIPTGITWDTPHDTKHHTRLSPATSRETCPMGPNTAREYPPPPATATRLHG
ncbi:MAG: hypothetical protein GY820_29910, partial [Gammaproteobacteria bacterium]|nr:hypothetical protein [Gammaproteobacteria bacterium]